MENFNENFNKHLLETQENWNKLPFGTFYYIWDPRRPKTNKLVAEHAEEICAFLNKSIKDKIFPTCDIPVKIQIIKDELFRVFYESDDVDEQCFQKCIAAEMLRLTKSHPQTPLFVYTILNPQIGINLEEGLEPFEYFIECKEICFKLEDGIVKAMISPIKADYADITFIKGNLANSFINDCEKAIDENKSTIDTINFTYQYDDGIDIFTKCADYHRKRNLVQYAWWKAEQAYGLANKFDYQIEYDLISALGRHFCEPDLLGNLSVYSLADIIMDISKQFLDDVYNPKDEDNKESELRYLKIEDVKSFIENSLDAEESYSNFLDKFYPEYKYLNRPIDQSLKKEIFSHINSFWQFKLLEKDENGAIRKPESIIKSIIENNNPTGHDMANTRQNEQIGLTGVEMARLRMNNLIQKSIDDKKGPKEILRPFVAGIRSGVITPMAYKDFNERYKTHIGQASFSEYCPKNIVNSKLADNETESIEIELRQIMTNRINT